MLNETNFRNFVKTRFKLKNYQSKRVKKAGIFLAIVGSLIGIGIILSFYGNYVLFEDLVQGDGDVGPEQDLVIEVEFDRTETKTGIYAVQKIDSELGTVDANILDPSNSIIESQSIGKEAHEGLFDVTTSGTYKLLIQNSGEQVKIFGVIGPEPDEGKRSLANISIYILVIGLIGMATVAVYIAINRRRTAS